MDSAQSIIFSLSILETNEETMTCGTPYKCALLKQSIIRALWEIGYNSLFKNPNWVRPMALERWLRGLLQDRKAYIEDLKWQRYTRFNIKLLEGKKKLDHVLSRVGKDQSFYGSKAKQGAEEGSMTRAATKVHKNNNNFIIWSLEVGSTAYNHCT